jgi:transcriptional regulator with XRE-family HTH domain
MSRTTSPLLPATSELLRQLGERLRLARFRRRLSAKQVAERAGMNPMTLRSLERGGSGVTIGAYLAVMQVLGIEKELDHIAQADPLGRSLQDARLTGADVTRKAPDAPLPDTLARSTTKKTKKKPTASDTRKAASEGAFISSRDLATLLSAPAAHPPESWTQPRRKSKSKPKSPPQPPQSTTPSSKARKR